jgi:hypothetical protein
MSEFPENDYRNYLAHHGILGMRWGVRRYQNKDGSLTSRGKQHYSMSDRGQELQLRIAEKSDLLDSARTEKEAKRIQKSIDKDFKELNKLSKSEEKGGSQKVKTSVKEKLSDPRTQKALKVAAVVGATALTAYAVSKGASKGSDLIRKAAYNKVMDVQLSKHQESLKNYSKAKSILNSAIQANPNDSNINNLRGIMEDFGKEANKHLDDIDSIRRGLNLGNRAYLNFNEDGSRMSTKDRAKSTYRSAKYLYNSMKRK